MSKILVNCSVAFNCALEHYDKIRLLFVEAFTLERVWQPFTVLLLQLKSC